MKKIMLFAIISFTMIFSQFSNSANCDTANFSQPKFSEISFKDSASDWIEIEINPPFSSPIEIKEDSILTTIFPSQISNQKYILIHFKAEKDETKSESNIFHVYLKKSGLTQTTEQLFLMENSEILDVVCWQNSSPAKAEIKDIEELEKLDIWNGKCLNSEEIKKNQSIARINENWEIFAHPTPGYKNIEKNSPPKAIITIQNQKKLFDSSDSSDLVKEAPFSINFDGSKSYDPEKDVLSYKWIFPNNEIRETKNPPLYKFKESGTYDISLKVTDSFGASDTQTIQIRVLPPENKEVEKLLNAIKDQSATATSPSSSASSTSTSSSASTSSASQNQPPNEDWWYYLLLATIGLMFLLIKIFKLCNYLR